MFFLSKFFLIRWRVKLGKAPECKNPNTFPLSACPSHVKAAFAWSDCEMQFLEPNSNLTVMKIHFGAAEREFDTAISIDAA
jgi:hypothetical protein